MVVCNSQTRSLDYVGSVSYLITILLGTVGMYDLTLGASCIGDNLPAPVYALLSSLNAATIGIIAPAAVQLAEKVIMDKIINALVFLGGVAGMLYTALWHPLRA